MYCFQKIKEYGGLWGSIKYFFYSRSGMKKLEEEVETLYYFLNRSADIRTFPKAEGNLRTLQENNLLLLKMFDKICEKEGWDYWLDSGTLLGAVRHNGFVPWDDDMDVAMPRKDYEQCVKRLPEIFSSFDMKMTCSICSGSHCLGIGFDHEKTGTYMDIFPFDTCAAADGEDMEAKIGAFREKLRKKKSDAGQERVVKKAQSSLAGLNEKDDIYFISLQMPTAYNNVLKKEELFPLRRLSFEGEQFKVPNHYEKYLIQCFGENYMGYPHGGILQHGRATGREPLENWAEINGVDIAELRKKIRKELDRL